MRIVEQTGSTNADLLADTNAREGDWLVARHQLSGRGRQGRQWASETGNFYGSTLVLLRDHDPPPATLSLMAGLALFEAAQQVAPNASLTLKWPNDLMLGQGKLAGILLERQGQRVVVGMGVNLASAPSIEGRRVAALDGRITPDGFVELLADRFARWLEIWRGHDPSVLREAWLAKAHPIGTALSVHSGPDQRVAGIFEGLDPDGALRLRCDNGGVEVIRAGDVEIG